MTIKYFPEIEQGSDEWHQRKLGILSASTMKRIITPAQLKFSQNPASRALLNELLAERITGTPKTEDFMSDAMWRGHEDEIDARDLYSEHIEPVKQMGLIINDEWGFEIAFSPDGLINDGFVEIKSREPKFQVPTIIDDTVPDDFTIQVQTGFAVSRLSKCDFISFCGGLPMLPIRVEPIPRVIDAIIEASKAFEQTLRDRLAAYYARVQTNARLIQTVRKDRPAALRGDILEGLYA
jgi:hypothetical protein